VADDPYAYLSGFSAHPDREGDTSNLNPDFASSLANAIRQARAAGLPVGLMSGYRSDTTTGSAYDAGGNSSHGYGLASDISGLDGPNGKITQQWAQIAQANGLHNPYGIGNEKEFNHWQLPPQPLEQTPQLLASLKAARSSGNFQNVWNAYNGANGTGPAIASATPSINPGLTVNSSPLAGSHSQFIQDYAKSIGLNPNLALGIANAEGLRAWSASNPNAASTVDVENGKPFSFGDFQLNVRNGLGNLALAKKIDPRDPAQWQAADRFAMDQMKAGGLGPWKGDPYAEAYLKSGVAPAVNASEAPGPMDPTAQAGGPGAALGTPGSTVNPPIPTTPGTTINSNPMASLGGKMEGLAADLQKDLGKSDDAQKPPDIKPNIPPAPGARNVSPLLGNPQIYAQRMAGLNQPMTWGSAPPGQNPWTGYGIQTQPSVYGTSLMSNLQQWMDQSYG
jgi:hypothetical protein